MDYPHTGQDGSVNRLLVFFISFPLDYRSEQAHCLATDH